MVKIRIFIISIMPGQTRKSAAVPFINQKGERSMKRVKVERYVAGKLPSYAKKEEDDEEFYTTDEDYSDEEDSRSHHTSDDNESEIADISHHGDDDDVPMPDIDDPVKIDHKIHKLQSRVQYDPDEGDNPLIRALRYNALTKIMNALDLQLSARASVKPMENIVYEDEDEDIRERHKLVKDIVVEETLSIQTILGEDNYYDPSRASIWQHSANSQRSQREETEDILKDLKLAGFQPPKKDIEQESLMENSIKDMIDQAKEEAIFKSQIYKKIEEDIKIEKAVEALKKDELGNYEMESVKTDDEDEDIAYEEWKLREMKRILRDRTARLLESRGKLQPVR